MSIQARQELCSRLVFQDDSQQADLMDPSVTETSLIALMLDVTNGCAWECTAVKSDHRDDRDLGPHCHYNGFGFDGWPLKSKNAGDYMDPSTPEFEVALGRARQSKWLNEIGLAGSAVSYVDIIAAGPDYFQDSGADHIHLGSD